MGFTVVSPASGGVRVGVPVDGISLPDLISIAVVADGNAGTDIYLNGAGVLNATVAGAVDLRTLFTSAGLLFESTQLLRAFRPIYNPQSPTNIDAELQFLSHLDVNITPLTGSNVIFGITYLVGLPNGPANVPYLHLVNPGSGGEGAGTWRVDLRLRHTVTD